MSALQRIVQSGVVPIVRAPTQEAALRICQVLIEAGTGAVEVTFTVPRAPEVIARLRDSHSHALVGAGTVLDASAARAAVDAGAEFLVSVVAPPDVMAAGREHGVPVIPGAFTPSEITAALAQGAEVIKLFPASVGGPAYLRALLEPLPSLRAIPTGGVSAANVREWFAAGALPVGVGSALLRDVAVTRDYAGPAAARRGVAGGCEERPRTSGDGVSPRARRLTEQSTGHRELPRRRRPAVRLC